MRQDPEGYQYGVVTAAPGKLAYYKQKRNCGTDEWIEGESEVIEYDSRADNVKFIRRAIMRRLIGATPNDESQRRADRLRPEQRHLHGQRFRRCRRTPASSTASPGGRVKAILTPKAAGGTGARPRPAQPAAPPAPGARATACVPAPRSAEKRAKQ